MDEKEQLQQEIDEGPMMYSSQYENLRAALDFAVYRAFDGAFDVDKMDQQRKNLLAVDRLGEKFDREFLSIVLALYANKEQGLMVAGQLKATCDTGFLAGLYLGWLFVKRQGAMDNLDILRAAVMGGEGDD